ncbi:MAG: glycosyltransferase family 2 protein [Bryobacteraceae bacterium]|nr:glycosyltransferase family 2 protein [Bryobacteraceae bacterium]
MAGTESPLVSAIICTYNPDPKLLDWAIDSLASQTLAASSFEVIVVDSASTPPVEGLVRARKGLNLRVVRENRPGLVAARCRGIREAGAELLVFVDDDNFLEAGYLEHAVRIAREDPGIGAFGGIAEAVLMKPTPRWKQSLLPHLGIRDHGPESITQHSDVWGPWEPIGAGLACRRVVACRFVEFVERNAASGSLGRNSGNYMSGEDTLLSRVGGWAGYACSYQPSLRLRHFMKPKRLRVTSLIRTLMGHGRSYVVVERLSGRAPYVPALRILPWNLVYRMKQSGAAAGFVLWFWDIGAYLEGNTPRPRLTDPRSDSPSPDLPS